MTKLLKHSRFLVTAAVSRLTRDHQVRLPDFLVFSMSLYGFPKRRLPFVQNLSPQLAFNPYLDHFLPSFQ